MGHLLAVQMRRSICSGVRHQTSSRRDIGLQIVQSWTSTCMIDNAIKQWHRCLHSMAAKGGHFEQSL